MQKPPYLNPAYAPDEYSWWKWASMGPWRGLNLLSSLLRKLGAFWVDGSHMPQKSTQQLVHCLRSPFAFRVSTTKLESWLLRVAGSLHETKSSRTAFLGPLFFPSKRKKCSMPICVLISIDWDHTFGKNSKFFIVYGREAFTGVYARFWSCADRQSMTGLTAHAQYATWAQTCLQARLLPWPLLVTLRTWTWHQQWMWTTYSSAAATPQHWPQPCT